MHQNLLKLILSLIGGLEKQQVGWPNLGAFSLESIDHFVRLGVLEGPFERDYVVDPRYGASPIPVAYVDGAYYLSSTDPNGPEPVEIERQVLQEYHLDTVAFLEALASANGMDALVEPRASGLWQVGRWQEGQDDLLVLFAPTQFSGQLYREVAEAERLSPAGRTVLLVPFRDCLDGDALNLDERHVLTLILEDALDADMKLQLPDTFLRTRLELDRVERLARWDGRLLNTRDANFPILVQLARSAGDVVRWEALERSEGQRLSNEGVRKSIKYLRDALCEADPAIDRDTAKRIIRNVRHVGYQLSLPKREVRLLD